MVETTKGPMPNLDSILASLVPKGPIVSQTNPPHSGHNDDGHAQGGAAVGQPTLGSQVGVENQIPVFQGLTVQQLLEAHFKIVKQELDRQRQEHSMFQFKIQQQLLGCQAGEGLVWDRPSS